jgi:predicted hydrocarbon binding protein
MEPQLPISVDAETGVWTTDGLPMIYVPRHFFVNNHVEAEAAAGREVYAQSLYKAGHRSAHYWCEQESRTHGLHGMAVYEHYLKRLSQRGWGLFSFIDADATSGTATVKLEHSVFVLAQGIAGVPVRREKVCYLFAGWFAGALDWVCESAGASVRTHSHESQCAAEGHAHCVFTVRALARP